MENIGYQQFLLTNVYKCLDVNINIRQIFSLNLIKQSHRHEKYQSIVT